LVAAWRPASIFSDRIVKASCGSVAALRVDDDFRPADVLAQFDRQGQQFALAAVAGAVLCVTGGNATQG